MKDNCDEAKVYYLNIKKTKHVYNTYLYFISVVVLYLHAEYNLYLLQLIIMKTMCK